MKKYKVTFAVWKHTEGWQPHNYSDKYINANTPEAALSEWADNMMATEAPNANSFIEATVTAVKDGEVVLSKRFTCPF